MSFLIPTHLSFSKTLSSQNPLFLSKISRLSLHSPPPTTRKTTIIRMGGGPRTYPGGVSKWQWKRMQAKKAKQLLKARLLRERQVYEMRKRAELKAAISELERPWEVVEKAPNLFSVSADEQVKVLADRFQKPGGFDLWTEKDGPQLFQTPEGIPSARFFPKGVVHSVKPYGIVSGYDDLDDEEAGFESCEESESQSHGGIVRNVCNKNGSSVNGKLSGGALWNGRKRGDVHLSDSESGKISNSDENSSVDRRRMKRNGKKLRRKGSGRRLQSGFGTLDSGQVGFDRKQRGVSTSTSHGHTRRISGSVGSRKSPPGLRNSESEVYDISLQKDGS